MEIVLNGILRDRSRSDESRMNMLKHVLEKVVDVKTLESVILSNVSSKNDRVFFGLLDHFASILPQRFVEMFNQKEVLQMMSIEVTELVLNLRERCGATEVVPESWKETFEKNLEKSVESHSTIAIALIWKYARHIATGRKCVNIISMTAQDFCATGSTSSLQLFRSILLETKGKREQVLCAVVAVQLIFETCVVKTNEKTILLRCASLLRCVPLNLKSVCSLTIHSKYFLRCEDVVTMYEAVISVWPSSSGELYQWLDRLIVEFLKAKRFTLIREMSRSRISFELLRSLMQDTRCATSLPTLERLLFGSSCFDDDDDDDITSKTLQDLLTRRQTLPIVIRNRLERILLVRRHLEPISLRVLRDVFSSTSWILEPRKKYNSGGVGLRNLGNTCYMNAALQALYSCSSLRQCVLSSDGDSFSAELRRLFAMMSLTQRPFTDTARIRSSLPNQFNLDFKSFRQQDAHEWIVTLLDLFCSATNRNEKHLESSIGVKLRQDIRCDECGNISSQEILNIDLSLCFEEQKQKSLQQMIDSIVVLEERMDGENRVFCEHCNKKVLSWKRMCAISQPDVLMLSLKRFRNLNDKIMTSVELSPQVQYSNVRYRLRSVIVHIGTSIRFGHYVTYTFESADRVLKFDDSRVVVMNLTTFQSETCGISTPYIALYVREDVSIEVKMSREEARYVFRDHWKYLQEIESSNDDVAKKKSRKALPAATTAVTASTSLGIGKRRRYDDDNDSPPSEPRFGNFGGGSRFIY